MIILQQRKMTIMRRIYFVLLAILLAGCEAGWNKGSCPVVFSFSREYDLLVSTVETKGEMTSLPDTNEFILSVRTKESGEEIYRGLYKDRPHEMLLEEGEYIFGVYSEEFEEPAFDKPQFGDEQSLSVVPEGVNVTFSCRQLNSGLRLDFDDTFTSLFPSSRIYVTQDEWQLDYPYTEERIAYFHSGKVDVHLATGESARKLLSRTLESSDILTIRFSADLSDNVGADFHIAVDTGRVWITEDYVYGKERDGSVKSRALLVSDLENMVGSEDVWVKGYIVGGDLSSSSAAYAPPFSSQTNFMVSDSPSASSRDGCASVELKSGTIRDNLNLVSHPEILGKVVYLKGNIVESYFGLVGIKSLSEYSFN